MLNLLAAVAAIASALAAIGALTVTRRYLPRAHLVGSVRHDQTRGDDELEVLVWNIGTTPIYDLLISYRTMGESGDTGFIRAANLQRLGEAESTHLRLSKVTGRVPVGGTTWSAPEAVAGNHINFVSEFEVTYRVTPRPDRRRYFWISIRFREDVATSSSENWPAWYPFAPRLTRRWKKLEKQSSIQAQFGR